VVVVGRERMLAYEGRFEKRGITLYDYTLDLTPPPGRTAARCPSCRSRRSPVVSWRFLPATSRSRSPQRTSSVHPGRRRAATSGARSLRVVEVLEQGDRGATRGGVA
jgi:hypothetical protein